MISVEGLTRSYGDFVAVSDVSFSIPKGQVVGLLGHNGAGKTTIMKMLTGFLEPSAGSIKIAGLDVVEDRLLVQSKIGYLPEAAPLYPDLTVAEYLEYVSDLRGINEEDRIERIKKVVASTGLAPKIASRIATLSKGFKQRLGVAQAILHNPEILVLDEPTSGLDPSQIGEMRALLRSFGKESTVIISTHILQEVEAICDRVIIILNGRVVADANLDELRSLDCVTLEVDRPYEDVKKIYQGIDGVLETKLQRQVDGHYCYEIKTDGAPTTLIPKLTYSAVSAGWQVYYIGQERRTLEAVFREINEVSAQE